MPRHTSPRSWPIDFKMCMNNWQIGWSF